MCAQPLVRFEFSSLIAIWRSARKNGLFPWDVAATQVLSSTGVLGELSCKSWAQVVQVLEFLKLPDNVYHFFYIYLSILYI
jgi:hypothetical protein